MASGKCRASRSAIGRERRTAGIIASPLSEPALALIEGHLAAKNSCNRAGLLLKKLVAELGIKRVTPHDLRRTCLTTITRLGFGRDAMDRIATQIKDERRRIRDAMDRLANHRSSGVTDVYDRHGYEAEDRRIMPPSRATSLAWSRRSRRATWLS